MSRFLHNKEHLARMAALFCFGLAAFVVVRQLLVPQGFGVYGHYRAGALFDNMNVPARYAGAAACADCHSAVVDARKGSKHASIGCEACHGPLAAHVTASADVVPKRPNGRELCLSCHLANVSRPKAFPQVTIPDHGDAGPCLTCHKPHAPAIS
jgi:predicted CXXCH cytochrome family protein